MGPPAAWRHSVPAPASRPGRPGRQPADRPADIPAEANVRRVLDQYLTECHDNGKRPSVLALATRLGMTNTTFRRHFPRQAREISETRSSREPSAAALAAHSADIGNGMGRAAGLHRAMLALPMPVFGLLFGREWFVEPGGTPAIIRVDTRETAGTGEARGCRGWEHPRHGRRP
jgi:hypothetical protein